ncbi:hypothetical protein D3C76_1022990 [compost metagenome]
MYSLTPNTLGVARSTRSSKVPSTSFITRLRLLGPAPNISGAFHVLIEATAFARRS